MPNLDQTGPFGNKPKGECKRDTNTIESKNNSCKRKRCFYNDYSLEALEKEEERLQNKLENLQKIKQFMQND